MPGAPKEVFTSKTQNAFKLVTNHVLGGMYDLERVGYSMWNKIRKKRQMERNFLIKEVIEKNFEGG